MQESRLTAAHSGADGQSVSEKWSDSWDYGLHAIKLSVQSASGGAEVHAHYDNVFRGD